MGKLVHDGLPSLNKVLLVKGLTANLISISQLCDEGFNVTFTKSECLVTNEKSEVLMKGSRSKDICYLWTPQETSYSSTCLSSKEDESRRQAVLGRQLIDSTPWLTERHGYDPTSFCGVFVEIR